MLVEDQIKAALEQLQSPTTSESDRQAAQAFLLSFQRNPESWHYFTHWVTCPSMILQLYSLQGLQAKINRDWEELEAAVEGDTNSLVSGSSSLDGKERLRDWFFTLFAQLVSGEIIPSGGIHNIVLSEGIKHKFIQTVAFTLLAFIPHYYSFPL